jgi:hypothetical protein
MTSLQYTHKNIKKITSTTRKNKTNRHNSHMDYSDGFIRRMTAPIRFTIYTPTPSELTILNSITGPILSDEEKWDLYINGK